MKDNEIETFYAVIPENEGNGYATRNLQIFLIDIVYFEDSTVGITARTLKYGSTSALIVQKKWIRNVKTLIDREV